MWVVCVAHNGAVHNLFDNHIHHRQWHDEPLLWLVLYSLIVENRNLELYSLQQLMNHILKLLRVHVHDLVDFVTAESLRAGENAAKFVQGKIKEGGKKITLRPGNRVRYTVPQYIDFTDDDGNVSIMFRATDVYKDVYVEISSNNQVLKSVRKKVVRPGEMQVVELPPEQLEKAVENITVSIQLSGEVAD